MKRLLLTTLAVLALSASAAAAQPVPDRIQVPAGNQPFLLAHAIGVQVYACTATADGPKWQFVEPQAVLFGNDGKLLGVHYAGPTWQTRDGSQVKAARVDGVTVDPTAIPWLLLKSTSTTAGRLAPTTYVQRLDTTGGLQPDAGSCTTATVGSERKSLYTADYRFWKAAA
jgi:opacity protein-like surface antigen